MIEALSPGTLRNDRDEYVIHDGTQPICSVRTVWRQACGTWTADWAATKARAEAIANALRHYQQSQEGEKVL